MTYKEEIKRLNKIINYKNTALNRASALIEDLTADASYYIDRNDCLKRRISRLEAEKAEFTSLRYRAAYNPREDSNWDSRPREEADEPSIEITDEGIHAIDKNDPKKQIKFGHENGESVLIGTDDNWGNSKILWRG